MKTKLLTALLATTLAASAFAEEPNTAPVKQDMGYVGIGVGPLPISLPVFSGGYRFQSGHFGADFPLQVSSIGALATFVKASAIAHFYPKPNSSSQTYLGFGVSPGVIFSNEEDLLRSIGWKMHNKWSAAATFSPEIVIGHQYRTDGGELRFLQAQISVPTVTKGGTLGAPLMVVSYGFGF